MRSHIPCSSRHTHLAIAFWLHGGAALAPNRGVDHGPQVLLLSITSPDECFDCGLPNQYTRFALLFIFWQVKWVGNNENFVVLARLCEIFRIAQVFIDIFRQCFCNLHEILCALWHWKRWPFMSSELPLKVMTARALVRGLILSPPYPLPLSGSQPLFSLDGGPINWHVCTEWIEMFSFN